MPADKKRMHVFAPMEPVRAMKLARGVQAIDPAPCPGPPIAADLAPSISGDGRVGERGASGPAAAVVFPADPVTVPMSEYIMFLGLPSANGPGLPNLTIKGNAPIDDFETVDINDHDVLEKLEGGRTDFAKALVALHGAFGPGGSVVQLLAQPTVFASMVPTTAGKDHAKLKAMNPKKLAAFLADDPLLPNAKKTTWKNPVTVYTNGRSGETSVQLSVNQKIAEFGEPRTEPETAQLLDLLPEGSELIQWFLANPTARLTARAAQPGRTVTKVAADPASSWVELIGLCGQYNSIRFIGGLQLKPYKLSLSPTYPRFVLTVLVERLKVWQLVGKAQDAVAAPLPEQLELMARAHEEAAAAE